MEQATTDEIIVIGAGLAGLCSAYFLRQAGLAVRVVERNAEAGMETSFANGGMLTPSMSDPWNSPGVFWHLLQWLGRKDAPMLLRPSAIGHYLGWGLKFLAHSSEPKHRAAMEANFTLAAYSVAQTRQMREDCGLSYALGTKGTMKVFRDAAAFATMRAHIEHLRNQGLSFELLDPAGIVRIEPRLAEVQQAFVGGIHHPQDETGNAYLFCRELQRWLAGRGVAFSFDTTVRRIVVEQGRIAGVETASGLMRTRRVVLAAASWSPMLAAPLGVRLGIRPVKGYSLSVRLKRPELMPSLAIVDDALHTCATPLGDTLRLAGTAEFGGWNLKLDPDRLQNLWNFLAALSPSLNHAADRESAKPWCGLRPMTADGRPYIGATSVEGLYVNTGHGHLGWTQAAGSGKLLSQIVTGQEPTIDPAPYAVHR
jgi:D-amino-acid dehydrogenase